MLMLSLHILFTKLPIFSLKQLKKTVKWSILQFKKWQVCHVPKTKLKFESMLMVKTCV